MVDANPLEADLAAETLFDGFKDVHFLLYTRENPLVPDEIKVFNEESVLSSHFNPALPTRYNIHGWNNNGRSEVNVLIRDAYLQKGPCNVIIVDWGKGANNLIYDISKNRITKVADVTAALIDWLDERFGASVRNIHVTGHSLGGHTAGLVGKRVKRGKVPRIVAFDPAGVGFWDKYPDERVNVGDAEFVEIIHTNSGYLGYQNPIGDVDVYVNNGSGQPGCGLDLTSSCAHGRSFKYFAETINSDKCVANRCQEYKEILKSRCSISGDPILVGGDPINLKRDGHYQLLTGKNSPYCG